MDVAVQTLFLGLSPNPKRNNVFIPHLSSKRETFPLQIRYNAKEFCNRVYPKIQFAVSAVAADAKTSVEDIEGSSSPSQDFSVTASGTSEANELRLSVEVSGGKTEAIFVDVFSKMVAAAQPIPGFRRVKGGKTANIPQDVLLQILGPSEVYKQVIKKVINSTIAEYVEKMAWISGNRWVLNSAAWFSSSKGQMVIRMAARTWTIPIQGLHLNVDAFSKFAASLNSQFLNHIMVVMLPTVEFRVIVFDGRYDSERIYAWF